jgi:hypothetical protein
MCLEKWKVLIKEDIVTKYGGSGEPLWPKTSIDIDIFWHRASSNLFKFPGVHNKSNMFKCFFRYLPKNYWVSLDIFPRTTEIENLRFT